MAGGRPQSPLQNLFLTFLPLPASNTYVPMTLPLTALAGRGEFLDNSLMRVGLQTISWGTSGGGITKMVKEIKRAGFDGVELAQVRDDFPNVAEFLDSLEREQITLIGVAGGSIEEKLSFVTEFSKLSHHTILPYIYADEWDETLDQRYRMLADELSFERTITVAIHPHMFKPIQTSVEAELLMGQFPYLKLLPDIAHLTVAGENVATVLDRNFDKLAAVHLKDWSPEFGRAFPSGQLHQIGVSIAREE